MKNLYIFYFLVCFEMFQICFDVCVPAPSVMIFYFLVAYKKKCENFAVKIGDKH